jgi:multidrug efflux system outer membrane protein
LGAAGLALCGCTLEPHYVRPEPAVAATWPTGPAYPAPKADAGESALPALSYRDVFRDPQLVALIERALAGNQDLRATLANVEIARAQYRVQRADLLPHVGADFSAVQDHARPSAATAALTGSTSPVTARSYQGDLGLSSFEVDLFGRLRSLTHGAFEQYLASAAGARAARLTLVGEVARAYLTLAADRSLLAVSADTVESAGRTVALTQARLSGGVAARSDLTQAQTLLDQARSDQQQRITQVAQDRNALELLVGGPVPDAALPAGIEGVDGMIAEVPAGLDSRILLRRPDVLEAEHTLRAANAQIGAARAAFFPRIDLTGLAGFASPALGALFDHGNYTWQTQGAATLPIFAGGANLANLSLSHAQREQALARYQSAVQSAFRDVADALARRGTMEAQLTAQNDLLTAATTSYELQLARYREGIDPYLSVLDSQRTLYSARQSLAGARLTRAENLVDIYQSVGGDPVVDAMPPGPPPAPRS